MMRSILTGMALLAGGLWAQTASSTSTTSSTSSTSSSVSVQNGVRAAAGTGYGYGASTATVSAGEQNVVPRINSPRGQAGPVIGLPLSGTETISSGRVLADGTHIDDTHTSRFYRDAQGRMRSESSTKAMIFDPVAGAIYTLDTVHKTYYQEPFSGNTTGWIAVDGDVTSSSTYSSTNGSNLAGDPAAQYIRPVGLPAQTQPLAENLPAQNVDGLWTKGSRITLTIPTGTIGNDREFQLVNERWYSDDLKVLLKSTNTDPRAGVTTYNLTNVVKGPQDPSLFQVPADYRRQQSPFQHTQTVVNK